MATNKTFITIGFSENKKGKTIVRFTSNLEERVRTLKAHAIKDLKLFPLPEPMTKIEAARWLIKQHSLSFKERCLAAQVISTQKVA